MFHSVTPSPSASSTFADVIAALNLTIQTQYDLNGMDRSNARRPAAREASILAWLTAEQHASLFVQTHRPLTSEDPRTQMARHILTVLGWEDCNSEAMIDVFRAAFRAARAVPPSTIAHDQLKLALELLDALIELQAATFGVDQSLSHLH